MKVFLKLITVTSLALTMSACSWIFGDTFRDRSDDYRQAKVEPPLQLPDTIKNNAIGDNYAIPPISDRTSLSEEFVLPRPEPLDDDINRDAVRINSLNDSRWILVNGSPGQVWPRLRGFLSLNQLTVNRADAASGIIETVWLQPQGEDAIRERFRIRIEQGVQRATSEVYVLHADIRAGQDDWPDQSSSQEREHILTDNLAQYLADSAAAAAVSMLAQQAIDSSGKVTLEEDNSGQIFLRLDLPFARAWASIGLALEKAGFNVDDLNRSEGLYYLNYVEAKDEDEPGFFRSLFSRNNEEAEGEDYLLTVKRQNAETVLITIEHQSGETMERSEADHLLKRLKRHIS